MTDSCFVIIIISFKKPLNLNEDLGGVLLFFITKDIKKYVRLCDPDTSFLTY